MLGSTRQGKIFGKVNDLTVPKGDGKAQEIGEGCLLGYVLANGYCKLVPPVRQS